MNSAVQSHTALLGALLTRDQKRIRKEIDDHLTPDAVIPPYIAERPAVRPLERAKKRAHSAAHSRRRNHAARRAQRLDRSPALSAVSTTACVGVF